MQDMLCFSHLSWNFVYQRSQHLLSRFGRNYNVYYFEEPRHGDRNELTVISQDGISIVQINITHEGDERNLKLRKMIDCFLKQQSIKHFYCWYYKPIALEYTAHLDPEVVIYDSMDELSVLLRHSL